jgi:hypothetical protein
VTTHQEKTMTSYSDQQLDAIMTAGEERPGAFKGLKMFEVAAKLAAEGHPLFKGQTFAPAEAAPAPATSAAAPTGLDLPPARTAAAAAPVAQPAAAPPPPAPAAQLPAKRERHAVARPGTIETGLVGLGGLTQADVKIPRLAIKQGTGGGAEAEKVPLGAIYLSLDPDGHAMKRIVRVLDVAPGRSFLMPYGSSNEAKQKQAATRNQLHRAHKVNVPDDAQTACRSRDRLTPEDQGWGTLAASCEGCPYSQWKTIGGQRVAPECGENYRLLVLDESTGTPAIWFGRKSAIKALKNLLTNLMISGRRDKRDPAGYRFEMSTGRKVDGTNTYYVPIFGPLQKTTDEEWRSGLDLRSALIETVADEQEHGVEAGETEAA